MPVRLIPRPMDALTHPASTRAVNFNHRAILRSGTKKLGFHLARSSSALMFASRFSKSSAVRPLSRCFRFSPCARTGRAVSSMWRAASTFIWTWFSRCLLAVSSHFTNPNHSKNHFKNKPVYFFAETFRSFVLQLH